MKDQAELFFDPFAELSDASFSPTEAHEELWQRYQNNEIHHDYTTDKFVADTQALMMDAQFVGQFEAAQAIAERMHILCGEDHGLRETMETSVLFDKHRHNEAHTAHVGHDDRKEKKSKKSKKKKKFRGWLNLQHI